MSQDKNNVIKYDQATWNAMRLVKNSIAWYDEKARDNNKYGTAKVKEKRILKSLMQEGFAA